MVRETRQGPSEHCVECGGHDHDAEVCPLVTGRPLAEAQRRQRVAPWGHRRHETRSKTIPPKRLSKEEIRARDVVKDVIDPDRPKTRADCMELPRDPIASSAPARQRPCPYVSCKHHLYLDVKPELGSIKLNFPDLEVWEMAETCSLDVADRDGLTLEEVGDILNLTRERIRQVEVRGLLKLKMVGPGEEPLPGDDDD